MLLIVFLHSIDHSGVLEHAENCGTAMYFYVRFTYALCQVCVNIYIMLSGYFMVTSKFRLQKLVTLWMEAAFYSFVLKLLFMVTGQDAFSITSLVSCFFPILTGRYWFLTIYVGMYLVSPFLNTLIRAMDKRKHALLNVVLFAIMSVWVSLHPSVAGMNSGGGWGLAWFVTLYITASWLRLYYTPSNKPMLWLVGFVVIPAQKKRK
jgi:surface polysaccharide O-acyltransferase-like enzyme